MNGRGAWLLLQSCLLAPATLSRRQAPCREKLRVHSSFPSITANPSTDEDQRLRESGQSAITAGTELESATGAFRPLPFCPLRGEAGAPSPSQLGPRDRDSAAGEATPPALSRAGHGAASGMPPGPTTLSLSVGFDLLKGGSSAGADRGGEEDYTWRTAASGPIWMARGGPRGPPPASPAVGCHRAGLRSSA